MLAQSGWQDRDFLEVELALVVEGFVKLAGAKLGSGREGGFHLRQVEAQKLCHN